MQLFKRVFRRLDCSIPSLKYYATSFWWAWNFSGYGGFIWASSSQLEFDQFSVFNILSTISIVLTFFTLTIFSQSKRLLKSGAFLMTGGLLGSFGTALLVMLGFDYLDSVAFLYFAGVLTGIGSGILAMKTAEYYGTLGPKESLGFALKAATLTVLVYFVIIGSAPHIGSFLFMILFLITTLLLLVGNYTEVPNGKDPDQYLNPPPSLWRFLLLVTFSFAVFEMERFSYAGTKSVESLYLSNSLTGLLLIMIFLIFLLIMSLTNKSFGFRRIYYPLTFIALTVFTVSIVAGSSNEILIYLSNISHFILQTQIFAVFALISFSSKSSPIKVFGFGFCAVGIGSVLGSLLGRYLFSITDIAFSRVIFMMTILVIFALLLTLVFTKKESEKLLVEIPDEEIEKKMDSRTGAPWKQRCSIIAERSNLSAREQEVFELLLKGHGANHISEMLTISYYTTRAHIRNIYTKTGVHTREQLIQLVEHSKDS